MTVQYTCVWTLTAIPKPFNGLGMASYLTSIATLAVSHTISEIHRFIGQTLSNFFTPLYLAPPLGVKPLELSNDHW